MEENVHRKSWFKRNWMWVVPTGGCLTLLVLIALGIGSFFYGITKVMSNSEPYQHAMGMTQNSAEVVMQIGDQIEKNGMAQGNISYENGTSEAELKIPVKGSKGEATVFVKAYKDGEEWIYEELYVLLKDSQQEINLLHKSLDDF